MGGLNSPLERQEKKEKLILKPHRSYKLKKCKEVEEIPANGRSQNVKPD